MRHAGLLRLVYNRVSYLESGEELVDVVFRFCSLLGPGKEVVYSFFQIFLDGLDREHNSFQIVLAGFGRCYPAGTDAGVDGLVDLDVGFGESCNQIGMVEIASEVGIGIVHRAPISDFLHVGVGGLDAFTSFLDISSACSFRGAHLLAWG